MIDIYLDIETIPSQSPEYRANVLENITPPGTIKKAESIAKWMDEKADAAADDIVAKTSFNPAAGHVCCIGWAHGDGEVEYAEMRDLKDEKAMIETFFHTFPDLGLACFIGHNVAAFDLRFLLCRSIVLGVKLPPAFPRDIKPWGNNVFDTMIAWAGTRGTISLDNLAGALGLGGKGDFDGSMVAQAWKDGRHTTISSYCRSDVALTREIHRKFKSVNF